jgi:hypothetical protein
MDRKFLPSCAISKLRCSIWTHPFFNHHRNHHQLRKSRKAQKPSSIFQPFLSPFFDELSKGKFLFSRNDLSRGGALLNEPQALKQHNFSIAVAAGAAVISLVRLYHKMPWAGALD